MSNGFVKRIFGILKKFGIFCLKVFRMDFQKTFEWIFRHIENGFLKTDFQKICRMYF